MRAEDRDEGLSLSRVSFRRGAVDVVRNQTRTFARGETAVVTGSNGVGKSTLLQLCAGLLPPRQGEVRLGGHRLAGMRPSSLVAQGIRRGCVFQQGGLVANLSALANVGLPLRYHADVLDLSSRVIDARARFCLGALGIAATDLHALPGRLSFGIRKRVAFARAMALEPNFVFFDDPDAGLDEENAEVIRQVLVSYRDDPAVTMVVAAHQPDLIALLDRPVYELVGGALVRQQQ
ncbi:MAG: ATP-binding cassette domain-containing protein [Myxococcota bacterium]